MSLKWTGSHSESGILRKSEYKEKKEELFVFGYSCKLFREDDRALHIDQGKHLIPWMGDETLKIDRYDARGALHELSKHEAPPGGFDWRVELTKAELDVEQLCDDERYRALHTNEDEEEMYKEEELKRLHAAGYGQVGFNYDAPAEPSPAAQPVEVDEPFVPTPEFKALMSTNMVFPETQKQNAIIEKTAKFIASQGAQMEILIKAKQCDNLQFQFLNKDSTLHPYYSALIALVKSGKWPEIKPEVIEEKPPDTDEYLHPSLASTVIESAPSIPSIHYKPSADCDYTMLISKMRGEATLDEVHPPELAPGEVAPPGTEPLPPRSKEISRPPVLYNLGQDTEAKPSEGSHQHYQQYAAYYHHYTAPPVTQQAPIKPQPKPVKKIQPATSLKSTGLSLMKNYNTDSDSGGSDFDDASSTDSKDKPEIVTPPEDVQIVIDKMAAYVARNGDEFADIVRAKNDPRFTFLDQDNIYYPYYKRLMQEKRGITVNGKKKAKDDSEKWNVPVSFSIKKLKEPDPILPKPALPYETSSDEDLEKQGEKQEEKEVEKQQNDKTEIEKIEKPIEPEEEIKPQPIVQRTYDFNNIPPVVVYKMEGQLTHDLPIIRAIEPVNTVLTKTIAPVNIPEVKELPKPELVSIQPENSPPKPVEIVKEKTPVREERKVEKTRDPSPRREKTKYRDKRKEYNTSKSESRERRVDRTPDREKQREKKREKQSERERKRVKYTKEELETEIISLVDNSDELIDLTGEQSDSRGEGEVETDRVKQQERRRRAAEFLKKVGVDPSAATLPTTSLASAMVDTLELLRRKKAEEEEKRRRREKRRHRDRREEDYHRKSRRRRYRSSEDEDDESSKKKKRKKDKKHSSKSRKKRRRDEDTDEGNDATLLNIDLTSTLKELRTRSPTKDLVLQDIDQNSQHSFREESSEDENNIEVVREKRKKEKRIDRQYSEGEWSSNSEDDSRSSRDV